MARATRGSAASKALGKHGFYSQIGMDQDDAYAFAGRLMSESAVMPDAQEGIAAFLGKRRAEFTSRASDVEFGSRRVGGHGGA